MGAHQSFLWHLAHFCESIQNRNVGPYLQKPGSPLAACVVLSHDCLPALGRLPGIRLALGSLRRPLLRPGKSPGRVARACIALTVLCLLLPTVPSACQGRLAAPLQVDQPSDHVARETRLCLWFKKQIANAIGGVSCQTSQ